MTKTWRFRVRLASFMNLKIFSMANTNAKTPRFHRSVNKPLTINSQSILQTSSWTGFLPQILSLIQVELSFTFEFVESVVGTNGIKNPDGNWTGIMGMIQRKEVDFCLMGNTMTPQRAQVGSGSGAYKIGVPLDYLNSFECYHLCWFV